MHGYIWLVMLNIPAINITDHNPTDGWSFEYIPWEDTDIYPSLALVHTGYILPMPLDPQVAFSIQSLELLHSLFVQCQTLAFRAFPIFLLICTRWFTPFYLVHLLTTMLDFRSYISPISKLKYRLRLTFSIGSSHLFPVLSRKQWETICLTIDWGPHVLCAITG